ncbi:hypothetical protein LJY25_17085 [Hymenobacter sp. BT175]|uniref:hypothetical protein n=1 Tax=Hymenobacter translucens TaxID=2886507 RepID=UPI001D0DFAC0|nr:hypothetical protein [Hymenobacter translucens]MCC2548167.1 hypothetical protein [Hymenobacter translucens]
MLTTRHLLAGLVLSAAFLPALAQTTTPNPEYAPTAPVQTGPATVYPTMSLGLNSGWGAPYGWGLDLSYFVLPNLDVTGGAGIGVGTKIGIGARYYLAPAKRVSPFLGANLVRSGSVPETRVSLPGNNGTMEENMYRIDASALMHLRAGLRWQPGSVGILGTMGYGVVLGSDPTHLKYPNASQEMKDVVDIVGPGGIEISLGLTFRLMR